MSSVTTNMRRVFAIALTAGLFMAPQMAWAGGGHRSHHGGLHLGIRLGHHGLHSGHHYRYGHGRGYAYYSHGYRSSYYSHGYRPRYYGYDSGYRKAPQAPYRASEGREHTVGGGRLDRHDLNQSNSTVRANRSNTPRAGRSYGYGPSTRPSNAHGIDQTRAWALLATDGPADALREFGRHAGSDPDNGVPKVGYALASAMMGDLTRGVWAMRRALRSHPHSLQYVTINEQLRPKVEHLTHQYEQALDHATQDPDAAFMVASLHHLLRNTEKAHHAIERAIRDGDHSVSAKNLRQLIEKEAAATATYASGSDRTPVERSAPDAEANDNDHDY